MNSPIPSLLECLKAFTSYLLSVDAILKPLRGVSFLPKVSVVLTRPGLGIRTFAPSSQAFDKPTLLLTLRFIGAATAYSPSHDYSFFQCPSSIALPRCSVDLTTCDYSFCLYAAVGRF